MNIVCHVIASDYVLTVYSCSLLKKVTKEHLKDDFDSLFKHLSSNQKTVTLYYMLFQSTIASCFCMCVK